MHDSWITLLFPHPEHFAIGEWVKRKEVKQTSQSYYSSCSSSKLSSSQTELSLSWSPRFFSSTSVSISLPIRSREMIFLTLLLHRGQLLLHVSTHSLMQSWQYLCSQQSIFTSYAISISSKQIAQVCDCFLLLIWDSDFMFDSTTLLIPWSFNFELLAEQEPFDSSIEESALRWFAAKSSLNNLRGHASDILLSSYCKLSDSNWDRFLFLVFSSWADNCEMSSWKSSCSDSSGDWREDSCMRRW